jgi:eukaryotic-like serine/threonine-protein kinase
MAIDPQRVQAVFVAAVEAADPRARELILQRECAADSELRNRVEALLAAHNDPNSFLDRPAVGPADSPQLDVTSDSPNSAADVAANATISPAGTPGATVAGRYRLLELIGEGGMGTVWMAEQREPVKRLVALKLIKPGMASKTVLARFDAERQALALMDHPNIAKVLDGGTTAEGHPYFVMELVRGIPLTRYCDEHRLAIPKRLNLFVQI